MINHSSEMTVELIQNMGSDDTVVFAARVSTGTDAAAKTERENTGLIRYLMRNRHGCYDSQTEVLTADGWIPWPQVDTYEQLFMQLYPETWAAWDAAGRVAP